MQQMMWYEYVLLFFAGSMLGWLMEVVLKAIQFKRFINRGFLIGPYCPIYGFGVVLLTALLAPMMDSPLSVFVQAVVLCGALEYMTSWVMEKLFHARWWDYSHKRYNLRGRICADNLLAFGVLGLLMIYVVDPWLVGLFRRIPAECAKNIAWILMTLILLDSAVSSTILAHIRKTAEGTGGDDTESITHEVRSILMKRGRLFRRALRAFPEMQLYSGALMTRLRQMRCDVEADLRSKRVKLRQDLDRMEEKLHDEWMERKNARK